MIYVNDDAPGTGNDGTSWTDAYTSLQSALAASTSGDEIWVAAGTYVPTTGTDRSISFVLKSGVTLYGGFAGTEATLAERDVPLNVTTLSGEIGAAGTSDNSHHVLRATSITGAVIDGFAITAGSGADGAGGGGLLPDASNVLIRNCSFVANASSNYGGAIRIVNASSLTVTSCLFLSNTADIGGAVMVDGGGAAAITNSVFRSNVGGAVVTFSGTATVINCTFRGNTDESFGALHRSSGTLTVTNSIVRENSPGQVSGSVSVTYSNVQGGFGGTGNIDADPRYVNAASGNLRLAARSPCIDAGENAAVPGGVSTDIDGNARFADDAAVVDTGSGTSPLVDMGAYERDSSAIYPLTVTKNGSGTVTSNPAGIDCGGTCSASFPSGSVVQLTASPASGLSFLGWSGDCAGFGTCTIDVAGPQYVTATFGPTIFVDADAPGANNGSNWNDAYTSLQSALAGATAGTGIWVAGGTYRPTTGSDRSASFILKNGVAIYGGFAGTETLQTERDVATNVTVLSGEIGAAGTGDNSYHIITDTSGVTGSALLDGFTITSANANGSGNDVQGPAMLLAGSPTVANCRITGNAGTSNSAILSIGGSPSFTNCTIANNTTTGGAAAVYVNLGAPTFTGCTFDRNSSGFQGGAMVTSTSDVTIRGCRFTNNTGTGEGGGVHLYRGTVSISDSIFSGNVGGSGGAVFARESTVTIRNSLLVNNRASNGSAVFGYVSGTVTVVNSTIRGQNVTGCGTFYVAGAAITLRNAIVWGNTGALYCGSSPTITYSDVEGGFSGTGNIAADPLFLNANDPGNFELGTGSPAIDAGDSTQNAGTTDLAGDARFFDAPDVADSGVGPAPVVDMGAFEYSSAPIGPNLTVATGGTGTGTITSSPGSIDCGSVCTENFTVGTVVTLSATPGPGFTFSGWSGSCSGTGPCVLTMSAARSATAAFAPLIHVDANATGDNDGTSWEHAYVHLQTALTNAVSGSEIWVADGTYKPTTSIDRNASFTMKNDVAVYGGFAGTETNRGQRDIALNLTVLSGEIGAAGTADNSYHVVRDNGTTSGAVLDGFTITAGRADFLSSYEHVGAGLLTFGSPTISNCVIAGNYGYYAAAVFGYTGSPSFVNTRFSGNTTGAGNIGALYLQQLTASFTGCTFDRNSTSGNGGAVHTNQSTITFTGCTFTRNTASNLAGAAYLYGGTSTFKSCVFRGNSAVNSGGAIISQGGATVSITNSLFDTNQGSYGAAVSSDAGSSITIVNATVRNNTATVAGAFCVGSGASLFIRNSIIWSNSGGSLCNVGPAPTITYSDVEGGATGTGNILTDPLFVNPTQPGDAHLGTGSPAIDAGDNSVVPGGTTTDLDGNARFVDAPGHPNVGSGTPPIVDMGAYEYATAPSGVNLAVAVDGPGAVSSSPTGIDTCTTVCSASFDSGEVVTLTATPGAGSVFNGWSGACSGLTCVVTMDVVKSATATFTTLLYVDAGATGAGDGSSWDDAYTSLQTAMTNAASGTEIWVAAGTYTPGSTRASTFLLKKGLAVYGGFAGTETSRGERDFSRNRTVLSCEIGAAGIADNCYHVVYNGDGTTTRATVLDGFTLTGGNADTGSGNEYRGAGMYLAGAPTIANCLFTGNTALFYGAGLYVNPESPLQALVTNSVFTGNTSQYGPAIGFCGSPTISGCTIAGNTATVSGAMYNACGGSPAHIVNSIIWGNTGGSLVGNPFNDLTYSIVEGGAAGTGNKSTDPLFGDSPARNFRLLSGSPAIDAGKNAEVPSAVASDFDNVARIVDDPSTADTGSGSAPIVDMGAYEHAPDRIVVTKVGSGTGTVTSTPAGIDCGLDCGSSFPDQDVVLTAAPASGWSFNGWSGACSGIGTCTVRPPALVTARFGRVIHVNAFAPGGDGTSWSQAYNDLQSALAAAVAGDEIWVAAATYKPTAVNDRVISFALKAAVGVYGGFTGSETLRTQRSVANVTTLSGEIGGPGTSDNSYHVVKAVGTAGNGTLDGFTITAGNANGGGNDSAGGGVYAESSTPHIANCVITTNSAVYGGGFGSQGSAAVLTDCLIESNNATSGGGVYTNFGGPLVRGCTIQTNTASNGGGVYANASTMQIVSSKIRANDGTYVGGVLMTAGGSPAIRNSLIVENTSPSYSGVVAEPAAITNCTIAGNVSPGSAALYGNASTAVTNSIVWGNTPNTIAGSPVVTYSDVPGISGTGNISVDPLFLDTGASNYRLPSTSPALDAGTNLAAATLLTDVEGKPRRSDGPVTDTGIGPAPVVDMGAYEFHPVSVSTPSPASPCNGTGAGFTVTATGWGTLSYQWRKDSAPIDGATDSTYSIASVVSNDAGSYDVVVTDSLGTTATSAPAVLTVKTAPAISTHPENETACANTEASFTVAATGSDLTFQWRRNQTPIDGATDPTYVIGSATAAHAGSYDVVISGACSPSVTSNAATLTVNAVTAIDTPPSNQTVCANQPVNLTVAASGTNVTYQWRKATVPIDGATAPTYSVPSATTNDAGTFDVVVTGTCGTMTSAAVTLTVRTQPAILDFSPTSGGVSTQVVIGGSGFTGATSVLFNGTPAVTFTVNSDTQITAGVPAGTTTGPITVTKSGCTSATSSANFVITNFSAPGGLVATATTATQVAVAFNPVGGTNHYEIYRSGGTGPFSFVGTSVTHTFNDTTVTAATTYRYQARAISIAGTPSGFSNIDFATTVVFTNDPLLAGSTAVKAVHWTEVRAAVNAMRVAAGLSQVTFTDPVLTGLPMRPAHLEELRNAIDPALAALGLAPITYQDPIVTLGVTPVRAAHLQQIRDKVK